MANPISLADAQAKLDTWMAANERVASGQSYSIGSRSLSRANLAEIREEIIFWSNMVASLTPSTKGRTRYVVPQ